MLEDTGEDKVGEERMTYGDDEVGWPVIWWKRADGQQDAGGAGDL